MQEGSNKGALTPFISLVINMGRIYQYKNGYAIWEGNERVTHVIPDLSEAKKVNMFFKLSNSLKNRKWKK